MSFKSPSIPGFKVTAGGKPQCSKAGCRTGAQVSGLCQLHWRDFQVDEDRRIAKEKRLKESWERSQNS